MEGGTNDDMIQKSNLSIIHTSEISSKIILKATENLANVSQVLLKVFEKTFTPKNG